MARYLQIGTSDSENYGIDGFVLPYYVLLYIVLKPCQLVEIVLLYLDSRYTCPEFNDLGKIVCRNIIVGSCVLYLVCGLLTFFKLKFDIGYFFIIRFIDHRFKLRQLGRQLICAFVRKVQLIDSFVSEAGTGARLVKKVYSLVRQEPVVYIPF